MFVKHFNSRTSDPAHTVAASPPENEVVKAVVGAGLAELLGAGVTPAAFAGRWRAAHGTKSLDHRLAAARAMVALAETGGSAPSAAARTAAAAHVAAGAAEYGCVCVCCEACTSRVRIGPCVASLRWLAHAGYSPLFPLLAFYFFPCCVGHVRFSLRTIASAPCSLPLCAGRPPGRCTRSA